MKKLTAIILSVIMLLGVCGCAKAVDKNPISSTPQSNPLSEEKQTDVPQEEVSQPIIEAEIINIKENVVIFENTTFNYVESSPDFYTSNLINRYKNEDGAEIYIDSTTNQIIRLSFKKDEETIVLSKAKDVNEVEVVAKKLFAKLCKDSANYNEIKVHSDSKTNTHTVYFYKTIKGYYTTVTARIEFDKNFNAYYYYCAPDVFKNIDVSNLNIDEKAILDHINNLGKEKRGENFGGNKIINITLTARDSKVIALVDLTELNKDGESVISNQISRVEFELG